MDLETIYNMAKATTQSAERMAKTNVGGYFAFVREYIKLVPLVHELFGKESISLFQRMRARATLINEEALLLATYLRDEYSNWIPRIPYTTMKEMMNK